MGQKTFAGPTRAGGEKGEVFLRGKFPAFTVSGLICNNKYCTRSVTKVYCNYAFKIVLACCWC